MGDGSIRIADACFQLGARLSSDDFFEGFTIIDSKSGRKYMKGTETVTQFPDQVHVDVIISGTDCHTGRVLDDSESSPLINSITFTAEWKSGLRGRPVQSLMRTMRKPSIEEWSGELPRWLLEDRDFVSLIEESWDVDLLIKDQKILITESLVITASSSEDKNQTRFVARF
jgi:hypothetical protein